MHLRLLLLLLFFERNNDYFPLILHYLTLPTHIALFDLAVHSNQIYRITLYHVLLHLTMSHCTITILICNITQH